MTLQEANDRLKKNTITEEQLWNLNSLYILLDLHKDDFCKIVDLVGLGNLILKRHHYNRLLRAADELTARERYVSAQVQLLELAEEQKRLLSIVNSYNPLT